MENVRDSILGNKSMTESHKFGSGSEVKGLMINQKRIDLVVSPESLMGKNPMEQSGDVSGGVGTVGAIGSPMQVIYKSESIEKD